MRIGIDVGATTTTAAVVRDGESSPEPLLLEPGDVGTMPSAVVWRGGAGMSPLVGTSADLHLDKAPLAGVRAPLERLESGASVVEVAGGPVPATAMLGALLEHAVARALAGTDDAIDAATICHPSDWSPAGRHARALRAASALAGLPAGVRLVPTAVAASAELTVEEHDDRAVALCDVGGTSCELSIVRVDADGPRVVETRRLPAGGDLIDESVFLEILRVLDEDDPEAAGRLEAAYLEPSPVMGGAPHDEWRRCQLALAREVRAGRERLAEQDRTTIAIGPPVGAELTLDRERVRSLAEADVAVLAGALRELVAAAVPEAARCFVLGGAAALPGLLDGLRDSLPIPVTVTSKPQLVAALGAARLATSGVRRRAGRPSAEAETHGRVLCGDVLAATLRPWFEDIVVVTHAADATVVSTVDRSGEVRRSERVHGAPVRCVHVSQAGVLVVTEQLATLFDAQLRPLVTRRMPVVGGISATSAWIIHRAPDSPGATMLATYVIAEGVAAVVANAPIASPPAARRPGLVHYARAARRRPVPACASAADDVFRFAVPGAPAGDTHQLVGTADADGLTAGVVAIGEAPWITALAPAGAELRAATEERGWAVAPVDLRRRDDLLCRYATGRARLVLDGAGDREAWVIANDADGWEARAVCAGRRTAGSGAAADAVAHDRALVLMIAAAGAVSIMEVDRDGESSPWGTLRGESPLQLVGRIGSELAVLRGAPQAPRQLALLAPPG